MNIEKAQWAVTGLFGVSAVLGVALEIFRWPAFVVALGLFVYGFVLMGMTLVIGAGRSRTETVDIFGLFFTQSPMKLRMLFVAQIVIAFITAAMKQTAAFGVLAPIAGLGLCGLWGARNGTYPDRPDAPAPSA